MSIVLSQADLDYSGMKKIGRVTISDNGDRVWIQVDGFEFDDLPTCRMQSAPMQSRARFASDTWEDHRIQTHPPVSKLGRRCQRSSRARSSSCRSSPDRLGSEQCSLFFLPIV